uniref:Uncharacterized protein n=1 Tax=Carcinus maenas virus 1 TaxID=2704945 RepID=A0A6G9HDD3_9VIRU|nr:hypothetical protein [Carcinus maenas virus 1]
MPSSFPPVANTVEGCPLFAKRRNDDGIEYSPIDDFINDVISYLWYERIDLDTYEKIMQKHLKMDLEQALAYCEPVFKHSSVKTRADLEQIFDAIDADTIIKDNCSVKSFLFKHTSIILDIVRKFLTYTDTKEDFIMFVNEWKSIGTSVLGTQVVDVFITLVATDVVTINTVKKLLQFLEWHLSSSEPME